MSVVLSGGKRRIIVQEVQKYRILREIIVYRIIGRYLLLLSPAVYFACPPPPPPPSPGFLISPCFFLAPPYLSPFSLVPLRASHGAGAVDHSANHDHYSDART